MTKLPKFKELGLSDKVLEALVKKGFEEPSEIQALTIPLLLNSEKDVVAQAQTGTGKTAAFGLPIIERLEGHKKHVQAIILTPTRELTLQVVEELNSLKGDKDLKMTPIYGGQSIEIQIRNLKRGVDVVVGTPGRVMDHIRRGTLKLDNVSFAVLDEADEMLQMGFVEDIEFILEHTKEDRKMLMFSATMPKEIMNIAQNFMSDHEIVKVEKKTLATTLTDQIYFEVRRESKFEALCRILDLEHDFFGMVFCRTKNDVDEVAEKLVNRGYMADALHGDISQAQRTKVINRFKNARFNVLVATDVAARGIDVQNLTHVINYSIPQEAEAYVHRIGRTGRAGRKGTAITFVTPAEYRKLNLIQKIAQTDIRREDLPDAEKIVEHKKIKLQQDISKLISENEHSDYLKFSRDLLVKHDADWLVSALLKMVCKNDLLPSSYSDLKPKKRNDRRKDRNKKRGRDFGYDAVGADDNEERARLFIAKGKKDDFSPRKLVDYIEQKSRVKGRKIDGVSCFDTFSFVTVSFSDAEKIIESLNSGNKSNRPIVEIAKDSKDDKNKSKNRDKSRARRSKRFGDDFDKNNKKDKRKRDRKSDRKGSAKKRKRNS
ncbi:DEAD/DEAH box helicase [Lentisphaerota bacterium WC36G]|nr:DEAD/DEAH box helicase [Lentisphaerae bacterium WC36]